MKNKIIVILLLLCLAIVFMIGMPMFIKVFFKSDEEISNKEVQNSEANKFSIGQQVLFADEEYNIIGVGDDYVTLLKQKPLTTDEINTYETDYINRNTYVSPGKAFPLKDNTGSIAFYSSATCGYQNSTDPNSIIRTDCVNDYNVSDIKHVVDNWLVNQFNQEDLKEVDGYKVRLANKEELINNFYPSCDQSKGYCDKELATPDWLYNFIYKYWTMSSHDDSSNVWTIDESGNLRYSSVYSDNNGAVKPVINVYKDKIGQK